MCDHHSTMGDHINLRQLLISRPVLFFLFVSVWESAHGWRWKTSDAIIQDVWPEESGSQMKLKRASFRSIEIPSNNLMAQGKIEATSSEATVSKSVEEIEDGLVFEGHYFQPNEAPLPPPPLFMVLNNNWRGNQPKVRKSQEQSHNLYEQDRPNNSYYFVGVGEIPPSIPTEKFTPENVKDPIRSENVTEEETKHSSSNFNPSTVSFSASSELPPIEDIQFYEERHLEMLEMFKDAPKCYTPTEAQGHCLPFMHCYPVVFNLIDGELRNPGLAKLLYQASGPCNATLELEFAMHKLIADKSFLDAKFYNQTVCCPGFKHPPGATLKWSNEVRNTRLSANAQQESSHSEDGVPNFQISKSDDNESISLVNKSVSRLDYLKVNRSDGSHQDERNYASSNHTLSVDDNSVESHDGVMEDIGDDVPGDTVEDYDGEAKEEEKVWENSEIYNIAENATVESSNEKIEIGDLEAGKEERRGDRDKFGVEDDKDANFKKSADAFLAVPAPNLSPFKCRQQVYGMPRGHWPWMVALVIRSRHICSGALIDERRVITAGHCISQLSEPEVKKLRIIIGDRVMYSSVDGPHFWRKVNRIITHVNYNQHTFANDIAILKLNSDVPFSRNIQPISLPEPFSVDTSLIYGKGIVAGWSGADIGQPAFEARTEVETVVDIMNKEECREIYRGFALNGLTTNTFCTKPANNTCVADSGAPLIVRVQNCWQLMGIMSWGIGCSHFPEVQYTRMWRGMHRGFEII